MRLILHIGNHKTGSTSIQTSLDKASSKELLYPKSGRKGGAHHDLVNALRGKGVAGYHTILDLDETLESLIREIKESKVDVVLISSEEFITLETSEFFKLKPLFSLFDRVDIACVLRNQVDQIESSYKFGVLWEHSKYIERFDSYLGKNLASDYHDYNYKFDTLNSTGLFDNIYVLSFSDLVAKKSLVSDFLDRLDVSVKGVEEIDNNHSLGAKETIALREYNEGLEFQSVSRGKFIEIISGIKTNKFESLYTSKQYEQVVNRFFDVNENLKKNYGVELNKSMTKTESVKFVGSSFTVDIKEKIEKLL